MTPAPRVLLASQSPYRRELLGRILPDFECAAQDVDESARPGEMPLDLALRLARTKAVAALATHPATVIIGSDQVAALGNRLLGKPGSVERAISQLLECAGQTVEFLTAVCILGPGGQPAMTHVDTTRVRFRTLPRADLERYVAADQPLDCAGSFKAERRGVILLESIENTDPSAIQGLPLIWVAATLRHLGVPLF